MKYLVATSKHLEEILIMKNKVKERVIKENLPIWKDGYLLDEMIKEDIAHSEGRIIQIDN